MKRTSKTCIAVIKLRSGRLMMAGDRRVSCEDGTIFKCPFPKISKKSNGMLVGASGDSALCKLVVDIFKPPKITCDTETYMYYVLRDRLYTLLKNQPGYKDEHNNLRLSHDESCSALFAVNGSLYTVDIGSPDDNKSIGRIILDDAPIPFAIGCGGTAAMSVLTAKKQEFGYLNKEHLHTALETAAQLNNGCDDSVDFIKE